MKKILLSFLIVFTMFAGTNVFSANVNAGVKGEIVYITDKGKKYHKETCRTLKKAKYEITKKEAIAQGYTACKVCKP